MARNMNHPALAPALIISALLTACTSSPTIEMSTPKTVVVKDVSSRQSDKALRTAESACRNFGKRAVIVSYNKSDKTATYQCRDA